MSFRNWPVLLLLVVPVVLLVLLWARKARHLALPFDHGRPGTGVGWRSLIDAFEEVPALLLAVAIILLAGPEMVGQPREKRALTNIEMCLDISYSMTTPWGDGSRYDTAMKAVEEFLDYRKGDAFGLTFFGNNPLHFVPLTSDISAVRCAPPFMRPENVPEWFNGTEIGKALRACKKVLTERQEGDRLIILVTDGDSFDLFGGADVEIAQEMRKENITVFAVIIGMDRIQDQIVNITHLTGGEAFLAGDPSTLKTIFQRIDQMKQTKLEKTIGEAMDNFQPWCIAGLVLAGLGTLALWGIRYTPW
jgi:Ca-activated chloride channel family protein